MARALSDRRNRLRAAGLSLPRPDDVLALARQRLDAAGGRLVQALRANSHAHRLGLERMKGRISAAPIKRRLEDQRRRLDDQALRAPRAVKRLLDARKSELLAQVRLLDSLAYTSVLRRGYAIVKDKDDKHVLPTAAMTRPGQAVTIQFQDGKRRGHLDGGEKMPPRQGSLF
jgi:exodeoxyribonuclease VII large subunit